MKWSEQVDEIAAALAEAQAELTSPKKTKTAKIRSKKGADSSFEYKFADLESGLKIIRETLPKHKLAFTQGTELRGNNIRDCIDQLPDAVRRHKGKVKAA